mgnify:FL=1
MVSKETYRRWYDAMDACNSSGLIHDFPKVVDEIWAEARELNEGTEYVNSHPLIVIFADKLLQLAKVNAGSIDITEAYHQVRLHLT